jgi:hypothetical protein
VLSGGASPHFSAAMQHGTSNRERFAWFRDFFGENMQVVRRRDHTECRGLKSEHDHMTATGSITLVLGQD